MLNLKLSDIKRPLVAETRKKSTRDVVADAILHQISLLKNPEYVIERTRYTKDDQGTYGRKVVALPPKPWWWQAVDGTMLVQVKYGSSTIVELEAGKPTIIAGKSTKDVEAVLTQVAEAVKAGKLDAQIDAARTRAKDKRKPRNKAN